MRGLMWFRENDLRTQDNTALNEAAQHSTDGLMGLFLLLPHQWQSHDMSDIKQDFILRQLNDLKTHLAHLNIPLVIKLANNQNEIKHIFERIIHTYKINHLYFNQQFGIDEIKRDQFITTYCNSLCVKTQAFVDHIIFKPEEILTQHKKFFTVFTPFKKQWIEKLNVLQKNQLFKSHPAPKKLKISILVNDEDNHLNDDVFRFDTSAYPVWPVGEIQALKKLELFAHSKLEDYQKNRDFPAINGTSQLSPYLAAGILSPRQCVEKILPYLNSANEGATTWLSELIWREFYQHILKNFPRVSMHKPFKLNTENIVWNDSEAFFNAWKNGQTGFPIIDAAMNQLNQTGWMHNRLRMITAMFLSKNLLIDWRRGEKYFMQKLIDGDLAANNGGWQWSASTGTDAVPYFRIFNPLLQTKRFDPKHEFIKQFCPDYLTKNYPKPIIDLATSRQRALEAFKKL